MLGKWTFTVDFYDQSDRECQRNCDETISETPITPSEATESFSNMSSRETLQIGDISFDEPRYRKGNGCWVKQAVGIALVATAIAVCIIVAIIVHYAVPCSSTCTFPEVAKLDKQTSDKLWQTCKQLSEERQECLPCSTTVQPPTTTTSGPKIDVRLPKNLKPTHYIVSLQPYLYDSNPSDFNFTGYVNISIKCLEGTNKIHLHSKDLDIDKLSIVIGSMDGATPPKYRSSEHDDERQFFIITVDRSLNAGSNYTVYMKFSSKLRKALDGLYLSEYSLNGEPRYLATTQFQPVAARKAFPCFDEPAIKATFDIILIKKSHMKALSNMPNISTTAPYISSDYTGNDWEAVHFNTTPIMSTYLLAFVICDFEHVQMTTKKGTVFRIWSRPNAIDQTEYAKSIGGKILEYFEEYFKIGFPLPKTDMIAIPDFSAGAMENWGLITYRETALLYDKNVSSTGNKERVAVVIAHELAHQWFGNLVTLGWWDDLWLNEGFASYVEYIGVNKVEPNFEMFDQFITTDLQPVLKADGIATSHPIYVPVSHPDEISEIFDSISYGKGASVIRMMNFFLGENAFVEGVSKYLEKFSYSNAFHNDLFQSLTEAANKYNITDGSNVINVTQIMYPWIRQMGYPVINITTSPGKAIASQKRFLIDPTQAGESDKLYPTQYNYTWPVPFTLTSEDNSTWNQTYEDIIWIKEKEVDLTTSQRFPSSPNEKWYVGNIQAKGFYRVNYEKQNWDNIIKQLKSDHSKINLANRAQLIDDVFNLAQPGYVGYDTALDLSLYLEKDNNYIPWRAFSYNIGYVDTMLQRTAVYGLYKDAMSKQIATIYKNDWSIGANTKYLDIYLLSLAVSRACSFENTECVKKSTTLYATWMNTESNNIPVDLKSSTYCTAIRAGGQAEWDFAFRMYNNSNAATEKAKLMGAMACTKEPWLLYRYLDYALDETIIKKQDATSVIIHVSTNIIGRNMAWDFVRAKWNYLYENYGKSSFSFARLVSGVTRTFNTQFELDQVKSFLKEHQSTTGSATRAFNSALKTIEANIKWLDNNYKEIKDWLESRP